MAAHLAEQIIAAVVTTVTGLTTTGSNVFRGRVDNLQDSQVPALCVYLGDDEPIDDADQNVAVSDWELQIHLEAFVRSTATQVDTTLNLIRKELTVALKADRTQGGLCIDTKEAGSNRPQLSGEGDKPIASQETTFIFKYRRSITDPSTT